MTIAARIGGGDPDSNPRLRTAVDKAKASNMPADNIKRAIQKGTGELEGTTYEEMTLEGYGPGGVAVLVEGTTDNRNRTVSEIRHVFAKHGGNLGGAGSVSYMFKPQGYIAIAADKTTEDKLMEIALEAGADDIQTAGDIFEVYTTQNAYEAVLAAIKKAGIEPDEAEVGKYADNSVNLEGQKAQQMLKLMEALEDHDDVQNVWANFDMSDKEMEEAAAAELRPLRMIILGVDPGSLRTGYGVIETDGRRHRSSRRAFIGPSRAALASRAPAPHPRRPRDLIARLHPDALAVEDVFHAVNTRTALVLGHVRGVVLLAGAAGRPSRPRLLAGHRQAPDHRLRPRREEPGGLHGHPDARPAGRRRGGRRRRRPRRRALPRAHQLTSGIPRERTARARRVHPP